ncbi:hypothetical protein FIB49_04555 [Lactococcus cremoris]|uniref:Uncharacterized protein n=1 Tax=Lactococcus lactis subsp. cremoris TaxID=1359 RepID=A0AA34TGU6_LACLC|nr:hypothetical protein [Lactococcus cremoris]ARE22318.1 hypothetical protein LLJM3_0095 [Lactococcus cremoris]MCT4421259.1 hypothetical protein [Lactococcus cremoris]MCT4426745.1 hypothetical protein [Lactococcus cremoris]MDM7653248.1 hypothetical protein [Lactococcus cremoris]TNU87501.1 hypothetical protein FIB49_04555 [Lactococcus cremoris]
MSHQKTYFMKTFNLIFNLILFSTLDFIIKFLLDLIHSGFEKLNFQPILRLADNVSALSNFTFGLGIASVSLVILLTTLEIVNRSRYDSVLNYFKSIKQTFGLRRFMGQSERSEKSVETQKVTSYNPIKDKFNRSVHKCCVDVMNDEILVFIKVPKTQQTQKILNELQSQIKEETSSQNPEYIFSSFERHQNCLWLQGTKRK